MSGNTHIVSLILNRPGLSDSELSVELVIRSLSDPRPHKSLGTLPLMPELEEAFREWQSLYRGMYGATGSRSWVVADVGVTHIGVNAFDEKAARVETLLNQWLVNEPFRSLVEGLRTKASAEDELRIVIESDDPFIRRLPWNTWRLLQDYRKGEVSIGSRQYRPVSVYGKDRSEVRILSVLGDSTGIDLAQDRHILEQLPDAVVNFLVQPTATVLKEALWDPLGWDILFFAGHSMTLPGDQVGLLALSPDSNVKVGELAPALRKAVERGLQVGIFNSCDGLGIGRQLEEVEFPYLVLMREPVPNLVAEQFLSYFLQAFSRGESFYLAMREARDRLEAINEDIPQAHWLPVIYQNPAEMDAPPTWQKLCHRKLASQVKVFNAVDLFIRSEDERRFFVVIESEISSRLKQTLYEGASIVLEKVISEDKVITPWTSEIKNRLISYERNTRLSIQELFLSQESLGRILILGAAGSGKTTCLLELCKSLLEMNKVKEYEYIPVVLNLSSWNTDYSVFQDWVQRELSEKFGLPAKFSKDLIDSRRLAYLLDGFDETKPNERNNLIKSINSFLKSNESPLHLVICSREEDYSSLKDKFFLNKSITLRPLDQNMILEYFNRTNNQKAIKYVENNIDVLEIIDTPLMLNIISQSISNYPNILDDNLVDTGDLGKLLGFYINNCLSSEIINDFFPQSDRREVTTWLINLANSLKNDSITEFSVEDIQPYWLPNRSLYLLYIMGTAFLVFVFVAGVNCIFVSYSYPGYQFISGGLIGSNSVIPFFIRTTNHMSLDKKARVILLAKYGSTVFLFVSMSIGVFAYNMVGLSLSQSLVQGIFEGVIGCIAGVLILASDKWDPTRLILLSNYNLNMRKGLVISIKLLPVFLLSGCITATVRLLASQVDVLEVFYESVGFIVFGQILVFLLGSVDQKSFRSTFELKSRAYKGLYNACFVGLVSTLIIAGFYWILSDRVQALSAGITGGILMGLYYGGGVGVIQHFVLRFIVSFVNFLPFKMRTLFDVCVTVGILQKTGMKYRFLHKIIQEYFVRLAN